MPNASASSSTTRRQPLDLILAGVVLLLVTFGIIMVLSSSAYFAAKHQNDEFHFFFRQAVFAGIGLIGMWVASRIPYTLYKDKRVVYGLFLFAYGLLILVFVPGLGVSHLKATRWIWVGFAELQPSEFAKIALILYLSYSIAKRPEGVKGLMDSFVNHLILPSAMLLVILIEPDLGTTFLLLAVSMLMLIVGGSPIRYLVIAVLVLIPVMALVITFYPHATARWEAFQQQLSILSGESENLQILHYQIRESLISFGSGRMYGYGLGEGTLKMFFLPQAHSDFILAILGQELGFAGLMGLLSLMALLAARGYRIAWGAPDVFGMLVAFGITTLLLLQFLLNAGVVLGILPPKGIVMPFISYGGSSMIFSLIAVGILLNISRHLPSSSEGRRRRV